MTKLRHGLPTLPKGIRKLPLDSRGYPIPWFVARPDGLTPDFRVMDEGRLHEAVRDRRCWTCGGDLDRVFAFVIGPMCAVNRISSEPPSHVSCAEFSAQACPFLSKPKAVRREANKPEGLQSAAGIPILRNPGVTLVWVTEKYKLVPGGERGVLFSIGNPKGLMWYAEGRRATREEVLRSMDTGLPTLMEMAERQGPDAVAALEAQHRKALELVPA